MTAKQYLSQIRTVDTRINNLLEQVEALKSRRERVTAVLTGLPRNPNQQDTLAEITEKIWDLERKINVEIDALVELKEDIQYRINEIEDCRYRAILEGRYLNYQRWEQIAKAMNYEKRQVQRMHGWALQKINLPSSIKMSQNVIPKCDII